MKARLHMPDLAAAAARAAGVPGSWDGNILEVVLDDNTSVVFDAPIGKVGFGSAGEDVVVWMPTVAAFFVKASLPVRSVERDELDGVAVTRLTLRPWVGVKWVTVPGGRLGLEMVPAE